MSRHPSPIITSSLRLPLPPFTPSLKQKPKKRTFLCVHCAVLLVLPLPVVWLPKRACLTWARALCVTLVGCKSGCCFLASNVRRSHHHEEEEGTLAHSSLLLAYTRSKAAHHTQDSPTPTAPAWPTTQCAKSGAERAHTVVSLPIGTPRHSQ